MGCMIKNALTTEGTESDDWQLKTGKLDFSN
jgi:hypothetical protein